VRRHGRIKRCRPGRPAGGALVVLTLRELRLTLGHLAFVVLALATLANLSSNFLGNVRGQHVHPRTGFFLQHALHVDAFVILLTVFFAGIIVWRERGHRTHEILDSQPLPNAVLFGSKLSALLLMQTAYAALIVAYGVFVQLALFRYTHLELGVYVAAVFGVKLPGWWAIAIVALLLQAVAPNMYAGYAMSALAIGAASVLPPMSGLAGLLSPGYAPSYVYSDMNGFGHYATPILWYRAYWGLVSIGLVIVAAMVWPRGATRRFRMTALFGLTLLAAIGCAAVIARNTGGTDIPVRAMKGGYIEAIDLTADFYPRERRLHIRGTMTMSGETSVRHYDYDVAARGFSEDGHLVRNGSVILGNDPEYFPQIARNSVPHWTNFHAIVSTDADQQPVATGDRVREWSRGNRRFAEFKTDRVIGTLFMLGSGNYARATERVGAVDVEVLYHPDHAYNLRSMLAGAKCGLEYGSRNFAPYPHRTLRIVELPAYTMQGNAQALSSLILWGENGGFITDVARDAGIDRVFSTAAHETGHQWWGNSVPVMNEVLSDDVRVACIEQTFGRERTVQFLRDMRWAYFQGRDLARDSGRPEPERSLRDGGQYNSGYILMWRLRRILGDAAVNAALHDVVTQFGYRSERRPAPSDVAEAIKRHAPPELHPLIADTFDHITLHPIRARAAHAIRLSDGRYRVTLSADLRKSYNDANELAQPAPLDGYQDWIDVGVYGADGKLLSLATQRITDPAHAISIVVDQPPARVLLDPLCTLLDTDVSDNERYIDAIK
jgi:ABC-type transport system involved in multi-copper enzyme maturation permease subunit